MALVRIDGSITDAHADANCVLPRPSAARTARRDYSVSQVGRVQLLQDIEARREMEHRWSLRDGAQMSQL